MAANRTLLLAALATLTGGPAAAQPVSLPGLLPVSATGPAPADDPADAPPPTPAPATIAPTGPTATLTAPPGVGYPPGALPPGSVASPWVGNSPAGLGCCGPVGRNGPLTYELYGVVGISMPVSGDAFSGGLRSGIMYGGGGRSLFFNPEGDRAWILDVGLTHTYNSGRGSRVYDVFTPAPSDQQGVPTGPDELNPFVIRGLTRISFNFGVGRDWFAQGPGFLTPDGQTNWRYGWELGGRWGTGHADLEPVADRTSYLRKSGVYHGVFMGAHADVEVPMGAWLFFAGGRAQWGYDWTDYIPPQQGDIQNVNLLLELGVRF